MPLSTLARAAMPFFFILVAFTVLITVFPEIVLYLPRTLEK
jgi:TRAP-type C4-dicarboxylate transport system permease large subunit